MLTKRAGGVNKHSQKNKHISLALAAIIQSKQHTHTQTAVQTLEERRWDINRFNECKVMEYKSTLCIIEYFHLACLKGTVHPKMKGVSKYELKVHV